MKIRIAILAIFLSAAFSQYVYWEPEIPVPGGELSIFYNTLEGALPDYSSPVYIHLGHNGWQNTDDYAMTNVFDELGQGWWQYSYTVPGDASTIDFVFTDLQGNWDNNGGIGVDWHINLNMYWSPFNPGPNDELEIHIGMATQDGWVAWSVEDQSGNYVIPHENYWPEDSYVEAGYLYTPFTVDANSVVLGPFNYGGQVPQSIKFRIRWADGEWDTGSNGQILNYDVYFDYTPAGSDPYIFFTSPSEGATVSGPTTITVVGAAEEVEIWVNGEFIGSDDSSPFDVLWDVNPQIFGETTITAIGRANDRASFIFRDVTADLIIVYEAVPEGIDDGVNIDGNTVTLALFAPYKEFVALAGSWNNQFQNGELMKCSGDSLWWYQTDLPIGEYSYQYNLENIKRIADPWSKDVDWRDATDTWESGDYNDARTVFEIGSQAFQWTDDDFVRPSAADAIIYELHVGDFLGQDGEIGAYEAIINKIESGYFNELGVNVLELMPVNEFEGSNSWGYNPSFYMAPESTYGTPDELRELVNTAHAEGIAVLNDVVFNHMWGSAPLFQLYQPLDMWHYLDHDYEHCPYFQNQESQWGYKVQHWHNSSGRDYRGWKYVRDALFTWVEDFHMDGFRFDHTQGMGWGGDANGASFYANELDNLDSGLIIIAEEDNSYQINGTDFDAGWDYSYFHCMNANILEITDGSHNWGNVFDLANHMDASVQGYNYHWGPVTYFENHDEGRIIYEANHYQGMSMELAHQKSKLGAVMLFTSQGMPMIFHGQEFGQSGTAHENAGIQPNPLDWDLLDTEMGADLFEFYRGLIALRLNIPSLRSNQIDFRAQNYAQKTMVYWRNAGEHEVIVALNVDDDPRSIDVEFPNSGTWYRYPQLDSISIDSNWYGGYELPASTAQIFLSHYPDFLDEGLFADNNQDGVVDILDIISLVGVVMNGEYPSDNPDDFDLNSDGAVDILDVIMLVNIIIAV